MRNSEPVLLSSLQKKHGAHLGSKNPSLEVSPASVLGGTVTTLRDGSGVSIPKMPGIFGNAES